MITVNDPTNTQSPNPTGKITDITSVTEYVHTNKQTSEAITTTVKIITKYNKNAKTTPIIVQVESEDSDLDIDFGLDLDTFLKYGIGPLIASLLGLGGLTLYCKFKYKGKKIKFCIEICPQNMSNKCRGIPS